VWHWIRVPLAMLLVALVVMAGPWVSWRTRLAEGSGSVAQAPLSAAEISRRYPGLIPFASPPAAPAVKPVHLSGPLPVVISRIPTDQKIVFVTIDDGWDKDPHLIQLLGDLHVPVTMFLTDTAIRTNLGYFRALQALGNHVQDHTLTHPVLSRIPAPRRQAEICGQADTLTQEFGVRPYLFRPPYGDPYLGGAYKTAVAQDIARSAAGCRITAIVLWQEVMQKQDLQYRSGEHRLHPGDIILTHFMRAGGVGETQRMINLFRQIQAQGFTVARLEDYL